MISKRRAASGVLPGFMPGARIARAHHQRWSSLVPQVLPGRSNLQEMSLTHIFKTRNIGEEEEKEKEVEGEEKEVEEEEKEVEEEEEREREEKKERNKEREFLFSLSHFSSTPPPLPRPPSSLPSPTKNREKSRPEKRNRQSFFFSKSRLVYSDLCGLKVHAIPPSTFVVKTFV